MDFASGLANLEQAAANSQNNRNDRRRGRDNSSSHYQRDNDDSRRYQPRPRHHHHQDNRGHHHHHNRHNNNRDRSLDAMVRYGYRLPRGPYHRPPPISTKTDRPFHICLLAITIDDLPYEDIWKAWAQSSRYKVSLLCHAKFPDKVTSAWLKQRLLLHPRRIVRGNSLSDPEYLTHKPAWGSVEITRAMIDLLDQGMDVGRSQDDRSESDPRFSPHRFLIGNDIHDNNNKHEIPPPVDKFIFISETCLPVRTLEECVEALFPLTKRDNIDPSKPRWEPPPQKEAEKKEPPKVEQDWDNEDNDPPKQEDEEDDNNNNNKEEEKKAPIDLADNPINRTKLPEEEVIYLDTSWVNARNFNSPNTPQNMYERDQFNNITRVVPRRYRWKADQWMALSREHAKAVLELDHSSNIPPKDQLWNSFKRINASDEMYFPTSLSLAGVLTDNNNRESPWLEKRRVTYTDWSMGMRNPASFSKGTKDFAKIARVARQEKTLFARKFCPFVEIPGQDASSIERTGDISVEDWQKELETIMEEEKSAKTDNSGSGSDAKKEGEEEEAKKEEGKEEEAKEEEAKPAENEAEES